MSASRGRARPWARPAGLVALVALVALALGLPGCRGCSPLGRRNVRFDGGAGDPVAVDPGALSPELRFEATPDTATPPTTPKASEQRRPSFAPASEGYGPSLTEARAERLYEELLGAPRPLGEGAVGMLVCHFETAARVRQGLSGLIGAYTTPTVTLDVDLGDAHLARAGASGTAHVGFTVPLVTLGPKSVFVVSALGAKVPVALSPRGLFEGRREEHKVACALLPHAEVEARLGAELPAATRALRNAALDAHLVDANVRGFGQAKLTGELTRQTSSLAALVGWADPRVARRTEWGERILRHHRAQVLTELAKWPAASTTLEGVGTLAPAANHPPCSKKELDAASAMVAEIFRPRDACAFRVSITAAPDTTLVADVFFKNTKPEVVADVVLDDGEVLESAWTLPEGAAFRQSPEGHNARTLAPGAAGYLHFGVDLARRVSLGRARALVVRAGEHASLVPVGSGAADAGGAPDAR
ncbi:MAG: hypothetical protein IPF92_13880 [Myxococcales bacterium]|nr:hypothetical protein [Myxococcales bacterium]MBL0194964.1 hypothetical protein [Myxococcales bacterium]HQY61061.1 hypothetical protein [Polyangiaceae bacterium]